MSNRRLDAKIMGKLAAKLGKPLPSVSVLVSKTAAKRGISAEAALVALAKQQGIGTAHFQRGLSPDMQAQIRDALRYDGSGPTSKKDSRPKIAHKASSRSSKRSDLRRAIEYLVQDGDLLARCGDILLGTAKFDRAVNQATLVLEDRIRKKAAPPTRLVGEPLVNHAFKEDLSKTVLRVASNDPDDQRGFTQIMRGFVPAFRNATHHHIIDSLTREEALRVVGFIDVLLRVVDNSAKV